jgi:hypothetical protein
VSRIDDEFVGHVQHIFRDQQLGDEEREQQVKDAADERSENIQKLLRDRVTSLRQEIDSLRGEGQRMNRSQVLHLQRLRRGSEALQLYARYVLGIEI